MEDPELDYKLERSCRKMIVVCVSAIVICTVYMLAFIVGNAILTVWLFIQQQCKARLISMKNSLVT